MVIIKNILIPLAAVAFFNVSQFCLYYMIVYVIFDFVKTRRTGILLPAYALDHIYIIVMIYYDLRFESKEI